MQYTQQAFVCVPAAAGVQVAIFASAWLLMGSAWGAGLMTAVIGSLLVCHHRPDLAAC